MDEESEEVPHHLIWKGSHVEGEKVYVLPFELLDQVKHTYKG